MKPHPRNRFVSPFLSTIASGMLAAAGIASAADLYWDGGTVDIASDGNGVSTYTGGTWNTALKNWDAGAAPHGVWNNANLDSAVFGGTYGTGTKTITIGANVTVNQIRVTTGSTGGNRYDIGASSAQNDFAITFGGSYSDSFPAIDGTTNGFLNNNFNAKITGAPTGGLVLRHGSNITTPGSSGRFSFTNANNNFTGDVILVGGNLGLGNNLGIASNKLVLKGGALFLSSGSAVTSVFSRGIDVASNSGLATNAATAGLQVMDLTGAITGSAELTRYVAVGGSATSEVRFSGDMSGFSGTFVQNGPSATSIATIQTTAQSGGAWKVNSGTLKLNTTTTDTAIANGTGKADLIINGVSATVTGTLDLNGKSETINGLTGNAFSIVQNQSAASTATLTLGDANSTASFAGTVRDGAGTVALTKIGTGSQTLGGPATHSGTTMIEGGSLIVPEGMPNSAVTVKTGASLRIASVGKDLKALTLEDGSRLAAPIDTSLVGTDALLVADSITFTGGTVTVTPVFTSPPAVGSYPVVMLVPPATITGTAALVADFSDMGSARVTGTAEIVNGDTIQVSVTGVGAHLQWSNASATGIWNLDDDVNFLNGASPDVFKNYDHVEFGGSSPTGTINLEGTLVPSTVTVDSAGDFTFAGAGGLALSAAITKKGTGSLIISNTNTNSGETTLMGGTLLVNGSLGAGGVFAEPGTVLSGAGAIAGPVTINGTISPGPGVATLATGACTLPGTYNCDIDGTQSDRLAITGNLDLTDSTLSLNVINPTTSANHVIATYTGNLTGSFGTVPTGYELDTTEAGKVVLWPVSSPVAGTIRFEPDETYPESGDFSLSPGTADNCAFDGTNGWSRSTSSSPARTTATTSSGEYRGGHAATTNGSGTYVGGNRNAVLRTGLNTISFDAQYASGISVGFMDDKDGDGLFDGGDTGMAFGVGGSPARFQYRNAAFGTENFGTGFAGTSGQWYRFNITIGESVGGSRAVTMAVRNLTTGADFDFDTATGGVQPWTFTVTDAQFGASPELSDGIFMRLSGGAKLDNIRVTSANPPAGYAGWASTHSVGAADADDDKDGVKNAVEYVLGTDPKAASTGGIVGSAVGGDFTFTFSRSDASETPDVSVWIETSNDLVNWNADGSPYAVGATGSGNVSVIENPAAPGADPGYDTVTLTVPRNSPAKFARLKVTVTP